jgi:aerobic-type carbon monoxide dehydrogenase small subunit (CoxS/CutS family)
VPQCGYCVNGWIMTAAAVLKKNPKRAMPSCAMRWPA